MSDMGSESDIEPRRVNIADVPLADIRRARGGTRHI